MNGMDVVAEARTWLGTPFRHQGRVRGVGVDCAGLVVGVAQALGIAVEDLAGYARTPSADSLRRHVEAQAVRVDAAQPGDLYLMRFAREPQHLAIATDVGVIHAFSAARRCVEHGLDDTWRRRVVAVYRFRELA